MDWRFPFVSPLHQSKQYLIQLIVDCVANLTKIYGQVLPTPSLLVLRVLLCYSFATNDTDIYPGDLSLSLPVAEPAINFTPASAH